MNNSTQIPKKSIELAIDKLIPLNSLRGDINVSNVDYKIVIDNLIPQHDKEHGIYKTLLENKLLEIQTETVNKNYNPMLYDEFKNYMVKVFTLEPLSKISPLRFLIDTYRILDVRKVHDIFKNTVPNYSNLIFNEINKISLPNDISLLNCVAEIVLKKSDLFKEELPVFLLRSSIEGSLFDFNENKNIMELLSNTTGNSQKQVQIIEALNFNMSDQIAFLKWRDRNPHIKKIAEGTSRQSAYTSKTNFIAIYDLKIKPQVIAYENGASLNETKVMCEIISNYIISSEEDVNITLTQSKYFDTMTFKYYHTNLNPDENGIFSIRKDKAYNVFKTTERLYELLSKHVNNDKLKSYVKAYNSDKTIAVQKNAISKSFVSTLQVLDDKALIVNILNSHHEETLSESSTPFKI